MPSGKITSPAEQPKNRLPRGASARIPTQRWRVETVNSSAPAVLCRLSSCTPCELLLPFAAYVSSRAARRSVGTVERVGVARLAGHRRHRRATAVTNRGRRQNSPRQPTSVGEHACLPACVGDIRFEKYGCRWRARASSEKSPHGYSRREHLHLVIRMVDREHPLVEIAVIQSALARSFTHRRRASRHAAAAATTAPRRGTTARSRCRRSCSRTRNSA